MTKLDNDTLGFVIHDVARMLRWEFDRRAQTFNLTRSQWSVLVALIRENGVQQRTLADIADVTAITMTGLLDRLERDGWVVRKPELVRGAETRLVAVTEQYMHVCLQYAYNPAAPQHCRRAGTLYNPTNR